jgi:hypothetical protein
VPSFNKVVGAKSPRHNTAGVFEHCLTSSTIESFTLDASIESLPVRGIDIEISYLALLVFRPVIDTLETNTRGEGQCSD